MQEDYIKASDFEWAIQFDSAGIGVSFGDHADLVGREMQLLPTIVHCS